jgi:hypothetical protein
MELLAELTAKEAKLVAKAQKARDRLRKKKERGKRALLGDICGNWTLHSIQYLDVATQAILETDSYPEGEIEDFETGQLKIGREYLDDIIWHGREDVGAQFYLHGMDADWPFFYFAIPKHATLDPLQVEAWDFDSECRRTVELTLLRHNILEMSIPSILLPDAHQVTEKVVFVGIKRITEYQLTRDSGRDSD